MSDKDFIVKLNDIIVNYGYIILDRHNCQYYFDRYNINKYFMEYFEFEDDYHYKFILIDLKDNMSTRGFYSMYLMLNGNDDFFSIFKWVEIDMDVYGNKSWWSNEFSNFMMSIKGNTKEEILLKLQMMGY